MIRERDARPRARPDWTRGLADAITVIRIVLLPVFLYALHRTAGEARWELAGWGGAALGLLLVMAASDKADGLVARRLGTASRRGAVLDAIADRSVQLLSVGWFTFLASGPLARFPFWLLGAYVARDALLGTGWIVMHRRRRAVRPEHEWHGKTATALSFLLLGAATAGVAWPRLRPLAVAAVVMVTVSTAAYIRVNAEPR